MTRRHHPSAFEISFPDEAKNLPPIAAPTSAAQAPDARFAAKRKHSEQPSHPASKRERKQPVIFYEPDDHPDRLRETPDIYVQGEDASQLTEDEKPLRQLDNFEFFTCANKQLAPLLSLDVEENELEGVGFVTAFVFDEDEGQEDGYRREDGVHLHLGSIIMVEVRLVDGKHKPVAVHTAYARYALASPTKRYQLFYVNSWLETPNPISRRISVIEKSPALSCLRGNKDLAVLRPENLNQTVVTPLIGSLADGLFNEELYFLSPPPKPSTVDPNRKVRTEEFLKRLEWNQLRSKHSIKIQSEKRDRVQPNIRYLRCVTIGGQSYGMMDTVMMASESYVATLIENPNFRIPPGAKIEEYFWFAQLLSISEMHDTAHVRWYEHSSRTFLQEISDPHELFLTNICDTVELKRFVGKVTVHYFAPGDVPRTYAVGQYFYKFKFIDYLGVFEDYDPSETKFINNEVPPDNCPVCRLEEDIEARRHPQQTADGKGIQYGGQVYHVYDFVLFRSVSEDGEPQGPGQVGQVYEFDFSKQSHRDATPNVRMTVRLFGRMCDIRDLPEEIVRDEMHLFATDMYAAMPLSEVIAGRKLTIFPYDSIRDVDEWKRTVSPASFFVTYKLPSLDSPWTLHSRLLELRQCTRCLPDTLRRQEDFKDFLAEKARKPLAAFDPFAGVGGFEMGFDQSGCFKMTHAVEISVSASRTLRRNFPDTIVYNQCSNTMLKYAVKTAMGLEPEVPEHIDDNKEVPPPPKRGDFQLLLAGFPCQSHSRLNMWQKENDKKSHLILNALSWVDFLRPKFCVFENVRGFLQYHLGASQAGQHRLEGGIRLGGLRFLCRALIAMGYQIRFGLLQAAHYGIPQARVRFFLIAAQRGQPLPALPAPTHDFPLPDALEIKFPVHKQNERGIIPIISPRGAALYGMVTVRDAIGDLEEFDWRCPKSARSEEKRDEIRKRARRGVVAFALDPNSPRMGFSGPAHYKTQPRTSYQAAARQRAPHAPPPRELQHFTRSFIPSVVESVVNIPMNCKADFRSLPADLRGWQISNPSSAAAKGGFRARYFARLDPSGWFPTTVTNMQPTAKQSRVLHPYCNRMVSVRELARSQGFPDWFEFEAYDGSVVTMHRQIGNAVPVPVSCAIGREVVNVLFTQWCTDRARRKADERRRVAAEVEVIDLDSD